MARNQCVTSRIFVFYFGFNFKKLQRLLSINPDRFLIAILLEFAKKRSRNIVPPHHTQELDKDLPFVCLNKENKKSIRKHAGMNSKHS